MWNEKLAHDTGIFLKFFQHKLQNRNLQLLFCCLSFFWTFLTRSHIDDRQESCWNNWSVLMIQFNKNHTQQSSLFGTFQAKIQRCLRMIMHKKVIIIKHYMMSCSTVHMIAGCEFGQTFGYVRIVKMDFLGSKVFEVQQKCMLLHLAWWKSHFSDTN